MKRMPFRQLMFIFLLFLVVPVSASEETASRVMRENFHVSRVKDSISRSTFTLSSAGGQKRERKTLGYSKLLPNGHDNMRLTRFISPADVKGTGILLIENAGGDDDMWIWLPALKKVRRLVSSNKRDSFLGTDFSYGDIIGHKVEDWTHRLLNEELIDGKRCYVIESLPANEKIQSDSGYSRRVSWIRADNYVAVRADIWDEGGQALKRMTAEQIDLLDEKAAKWQPMLLKAHNLQTGHNTTIHIDEIRVNQNLEDKVFTTRALERE